MTFVLAWARAFAITLLVELPVGVPLLGRGETKTRRAAAVLFAQLASHPAVWFVFPNLHLGRTPYLLVAEGWAVASEVLLYRLVFANLPWSRALAASALANAMSFSVGLWIG